VKILFDHQIFSMQRYGGISRYFFNLYNGLNATHDVSSSIAALFAENEYIKNIPPLNNTIGEKLFSGHANRINRWNRRYSKLKIKLNNFDVFHPTYYDPYFLDEIKKPFVVTVYDMIHEVMADKFTDNNNVIAQKKLLINKAAAVIAISEYTKQDIIKFYPGAASKITVIHLGYVATENQAPANPNLPEPYILFVGERNFYKNFTGMVKAIAGLLNKNKELKLLCTGGGKFTTEEQALFNQLNISSQCEQINATETSLNQLYRQARLFVFPSFAEGFGLPLLEAFAAGCAVAGSNNTCFPEIGRGAIAYFDPYDAESMANTIQTMLTDEHKRATYISAGYERLKHFTIQKQVNETVAIYRKVAEK
jgi:glycosyltransferase involved in cell wall biosynthesis